MNLPRIIIAGTHSAAGKTTLALGIMSALRKRGMVVQPFKTGPDYIDPSHHGRAAGLTSRNLDSWLLSKDAILELFVKRSVGADISIIEGVMGLYDGLADTEEGSTAQLSKILKCPVILIIDARSLSRSAAAVALGYKKLDEKVDIAGIILNNIASVNHYNYIKAAVEREAGMPVLGCLPRHPVLKLSERHLGLIPAKEKRLYPGFLKRLSKLVEDHVDLAKILEISRRAKPLPRPKEKIFKKVPSESRVKIAVAKDEAFNFYYQDNLDILNHLGADIVTFSPLKDRKLPGGIDGLYIGGGFPELFAAKLSANKGLKREISERSEEGLPIYAECGGLMYLVESLVDFNKKRFPMVGIFKASAKMGGRLHRMGYVNIRVMKDNILSKKGGCIRAHAFHWSRLDNLPDAAAFAYKAEKNKKNIFYDGLIKWNVLASYAHLHFASDVSLAGNFIKSCRQYGGRNG